MAPSKDSQKAYWTVTKKTHPMGSTKGWCLVHRSERTSGDWMERPIRGQTAQLFSIETVHATAVKSMDDLMSAQLWWCWARLIRSAWQYSQNWAR